MKKLSLVKAESLIFLKSLGLAPEPLLIFDRLPLKDNLFTELKKAGFYEGQEITVRFAFPQIMEMPRSVILKSFNEVDAFIKKYFRKSSLIIIHPFVRALYVGTLYFAGQKIFINIIKSGIWEPSVAKNCDIFIFEKDKVVIYRYKKPRITYWPQGRRLEKKIINPLDKKEIENLSKIFFQNKDILFSIKKFPKMILEFIITPAQKLIGMELEYPKGKNLFIPPQSPSENLKIIKRYKDIEKWDRQKDLLLSITVFRRDRDKFLDLVKKIKPFKKEVFVEYGLLSHPAILLREQGINTKPYMADYEIIKHQIN